MCLVVVSCGVIWCGVSLHRVGCGYFCLSLCHVKHQNTSTHGYQRTTFCLRGIRNHCRLFLSLHLHRITPKTFTMNYPISNHDHESFAQRKIRTAFFEECERIVTEFVSDELTCMANDSDTLNGFKESYEKDNIWSNDNIQGIADRACESLMYLDTYYAETKGRGDIEDVWDAMVTILEDEGCEYLVSEMFHKDTNEPLLHKANRLVNVTAEVVASHLAQWSMYDCLQSLFTSHQIEIVEP